MPSTKEKVIAATRSTLPGTVIDFSGDEVRFKTLVGNTIFTITNPVLGRVIVIQLDGVFTVTLPATVDTINGAYSPNLGTNFLFLYCDDAAAPHYLASWTVQV